jgi:hypothetical protein
MQFPDSKTFRVPQIRFDPLPAQRLASLGNPLQSWPLVSLTTGFGFRYVIGHLQE